MLCACASARESVGLLGEGERLLRERLRLVVAPPPVRVEAPVGDDACRERRGRVGAERVLERVLGELPFPAPLVEEADAVLDRAEPLGAGERRGGLVAVERAAVLACERLEIADRLVQRCGIAVAERERLAERGERLGVRVQVAGLLAGAAVGGGGFRVAAGEPQMGGDRAGIARVESVGCAAVQEPPPPGARQLVRDPPRLFVPERELARVVLGEDAAPGQLLEGCDRLLVAPSAHGADETGVGRATEHRRRGDDLPRDLADTGRRAPRASRARPAAETRRPPASRGTRRRRTAVPASPRTAARRARATRRPRRRARRRRRGRAARGR